MLLETGVANNLGPDSDEDVEVQRSSKLATLATLEVAVDNPCLDAFINLDDPIAVDSILIACEQAHTLLVLHRQEFLLVAVRQHESEAVKCASWEVRLRWLVAGSPEEPLLVLVVHVACLHEDHSAVDLALCSIHARPSPALEEARLVVKHPLLAPVACIAWVHLKTDKRSGSIDRIQAQACLTLDRSSLLDVCPVLASLPVSAAPHCNL
mmetsp:Transcript_95862/g.232996  ORF Transcript_95862/g.232996 Transcript_95862/m.232996 type:complete len:210 (-) Transcript_95862:674-1303(-)